MVIWQGLEMGLWKWGILVSSEIMELIELATGLGKLVLAVSLSERKKTTFPTPIALLLAVWAGILLEPLTHF